MKLFEKQPILNPLRVKFSILYVLLIPLVNWAFANTGVVTLPDGGIWSPFSIVVGLTFVVRDFSQREIGHYVFIPLLLGASLSYLMADPRIATASVMAFLFGEGIDWCVYTFTKYPLSTRVLLSSIVAVPIDSTIFLVGANMVVPGLLNYWTYGTMILGKLSGAVIVFYVIRKRERQELLLAAQSTA